MARPKVGDELRYRLSTDSRSGKRCAARLTLTPTLTPTPTPTPTPSLTLALTRCAARITVLEPGTILREIVISGR